MSSKDILGSDTLITLASKGRGTSVSRGAPRSVGRGSTIPMDLTSQTTTTSTTPHARKDTKSESLVLDRVVTIVSKLVASMNAVNEKLLLLDEKSVFMSDTLRSISTDIAHLKELYAISETRRAEEEEHESSEAELALKALDDLTITNVDNE